MKDFTLLEGTLCIMVALSGFLGELNGDTTAVAISISALFIGYVIHGRK